MRSTIPQPSNFVALERVVERLRRGEVDERVLNRLIELIEQQHTTDRELQLQMLEWIEEAEEAALTWIRRVSEQLDEFARQYHMKKAYEAFGRTVD